MAGITQIDRGKQKNGTYRREIKRSWWMQLPFYSAYMLREATAIFTLLYTIILIFGLGALAKGKSAFVDWASAQSHGAVMWFAVIAFVMVFYHTITWFAATPKVMPLQVGAKKVPAALIIAAHWMAFFVLLIIVMALVGLK